MNSRIKSLIAHLGVSERAFALSCGMRQNTFNNQLNGIRELSLSTVMAILQNYPSVSSDWLLRGEGEMFKTESVDSNADRVMKLVDTITTLQEALNAKSETISTLSERIKQLESQLKNK